MVHAVFIGTMIHVTILKNYFENTEMRHQMLSEFLLFP